MPIATLTSKGQVTIPKEVRERLRLRAGDRIEFVVAADGTVSVRTPRRDVREFAGILKGRLKKPLTIEQMNRIIERGWAGDFRE